MAISCKIFTTNHTNHTNSLFERVIFLPSLFSLFYRNKKGILEISRKSIDTRGLCGSCGSWLIILFIFLANALYAQAPGYHIEVQTRFIQYLSWESDGFALRYQVEIERQEQGVFRRHLLESTENSYITVSLPPGNFRYRVIPFNLLNRPGRASEWLSFEIRPAVNPELERFSPDSFFVDSDRNYVLNLYGNNILPGSEIFLQNLFDDIIFPADVQVLSNTQALLTFTHQQLITGVFQIVVRNPGGLEAAIRGFVINKPAANEDIFLNENVLIDDDIASSRPPINIYFGTSWITIVNLQGENHPLEEFLSGAAVNIGIVSSSLSFFNIGFELSGAWYSIDSLLNDEEIGQSLLLETCFLLRKNSLTRKTALTFRAGAGMVLPISGDLSVMYMNTGLSFLWLPFKRLYLEAGLNYSLLLAPENSSGLLRPWAGLGVKF